MQEEQTTGPGAAAASPSARHWSRSLPWVLVLILAVALVLAVRRPATDDGSAPLVLVPSPSSVQRWHLHPMTLIGPDRNQPTHRMHYAHGELRVTSTAANTAATRREVWTLDHDYRNVDVTVEIGEPSSLGAESTPQPGLAVRTRIDADGSGSAIVVDANVWARSFTMLKVGIWSWPADLSGVHIDSLRSSFSMPRRTGRITSVGRAAGDPASDVIGFVPNYDVESDYGFRAGDHVNIKVPTDHSYDQSDAVVTKVSGDSLVVDHPGETGAEKRAPATGTITFHTSAQEMPPRALYPRYLRVRIVGTKLSVKTWLVDQPEPGWQLEYRLPKAPELADTGKIGLVTNHFRGAGQYIAFGDVTITPVRAH